MAEPAMRYEAYEAYEEAETYGTPGGDDPEFYSSEGLDVEYITRKLKEAEDDPDPRRYSREEVGAWLSERFGL